MASITMSSLAAENRTGVVVGMMKAVAQSAATLHVLLARTSRAVPSKASTTCSAHVYQAAWHLDEASGAVHPLVLQ